MLIGVLQPAVCHKIDRDPADWILVPFDTQLLYFTHEALARIEEAFTIPEDFEGGVVTSAGTDLLHLSPL